MNRSDTQLAQSSQPPSIHHEAYQPRSHRGSQAFTKGERIGLFVLSLVLGTLLSLAAWLKPDPAGLGTHTQLGLPGCTMYTLLGIRCPGCGMTTSWAHVMNGDLRSAFRANMGGVLLCCMAIIATPIMMWLAINGRPISNYWFAKFAIASLIVAVSVSVVEWMFRLAFGNLF